jgi:hypothetical protein
VARTRLERLWFWFRDLWGVVWALRTLERFNRTAELKGWPVRLGWYGLDPVAGSLAEEPLQVPPEAEPTLRGLIRRFAHSGRLDEVLGPSTSSSCDQPDPAG